MELLRTRRLTLRAWAEDDLAAYFAVYSHWEVMRWLGPHPRRAVTDLTAAQARLRRARERHAAVTRPQGVWAIVPHAEGVPVGTVLLLPLQDAGGATDETEIGWHLHPGHQGHGLVTEAAQALLQVAALPRVLALTDPDNKRSQAVARRLDMTDEGLTDRWFGLTTRQYAI